MELFTYLMAKNDHNTSVKKDLFSYLLGKNQSGTYQEYTGTSLSISNTKKGKMKLDLYGNTSQSGTPTPDSPQQIHTVTGDNTIKVCGKNLVEDTLVNYAIGSNGSMSSNSNYDLAIAKIEQGKTYTITTDDASLVAGFYYNKPTSSSITYDNSRLVQSSKTFTAPITGYIAFRTLVGYATPMLNVGSTALPYEPYTSSSYPLTLGSIELNKIGTYQDYFYKDNGNWYLHKEIGKETDTSGSTGITINDMVNNGSIYSYYGGSVSGKTITYDSAISDTNTILYQKATATDTPVTDTTLINQLEAIYNAKSYKDQTNISQTNDDLPFEMKVKVKVSS